MSEILEMLIPAVEQQIASPETPFVRAAFERLLTEADIDELVLLGTELSKIVPLSLGIAPFVAKRNTPLDGHEFAGIKAVQRRLKRLRRGLKGRVDLRATSARWAWVEYMLAQGGRAEGKAVLDALKRGGSFRDYERAFSAPAAASRSSPDVSRFETGRPWLRLGTCRARRQARSINVLIVGCFHAASMRGCSRAGRHGGC